MKSVPASTWLLHLQTPTSEQKGKDTLSEPCQGGWSHPELAMDFPIPVKTLLVWFAITWDWLLCSTLVHAPAVHGCFLEAGIPSMRYDSTIWIPTVWPREQSHNHHKEQAVIYYRPRDRQQPCPWGTDSSCLRSRLELSEFFHYVFVSGPCKGQGWFLHSRDNVIPQFVTRDANIRNKLCHDPILTICWWNSWGPVVFSKIKNAC